MSDDNPITDAYDPKKVAETWTDCENTTVDVSFKDKCLADNQPEDDYEPVYATLHFYYGDKDSMRRFRLCNQAEDTRFALSEYDNKLRAFVKYGVENTIYAEQEPEEVIRMVRELFHSYLNDYGIDLTED